MRVRVLFFGMLKDLVGKASDTLDLDQGASVADLTRALRDADSDGFASRCLRWRWR